MSEASDGKALRVSSVFFCRHSPQQNNASARLRCSARPSKTSTVDVALQPTSRDRRSSRKFPTNLDSAAVRCALWSCQIGARVRATLLSREMFRHEMGGRLSRLLEPIHRVAGCYYTVNTSIGRSSSRARFLQEFTRRREGRLIARQCANIQEQRLYDRRVMKCWARACRMPKRQARFKATRGEENKTIQVEC